MFALHELFDIPWLHFMHHINYYSDKVITARLKLRLWYISSPVIDQKVTFNDSIRVLGYRDSVSTPTRQSESQIL